MSKKETIAPESETPEGEAAEVAEATGADTIEVEWNNRSWTIPANYGLAPAVAFRGIRRIGEAGTDVEVDDLAEAVDVVEALLGRSQFRQWARGDRTTLNDAFDLVNAVVAAWGSTPGE